MSNHRAIMRVAVLRIGHRPERDKRITTHVGLARPRLRCGGDAHEWPRCSLSCFMISGLVRPLSNIARARINRRNWRTIIPKIAWSS